MTDHATDCAHEFGPVVLATKLSGQTFQRVASAACTKCYFMVHAATEITRATMSSDYTARDQALRDTVEAKIQELAA